MKAVLVGNQNSGKTTLFNRLTGRKTKNWELAWSYRSQKKWMDHEHKGRIN